jgi:hypothetical protein
LTVPIATAQRDADISGSADGAADERADLEYAAGAAR